MTQKLENELEENCSMLSEKNLRKIWNEMSASQHLAAHYMLNCEAYTSFITKLFAEKK